MAEFQQGEDARAGGGARVSTIGNVLGGAASLALLIGGGIWVYDLIMRDVSDVPVVRAVEGPMRVQPDEPGGKQALHQGLAVNEVAGAGSAAAPAERLILAPEPLELGLEDEAFDFSTGNTGPVPAPGAAQAPERDSLQLASIDALAEDLADGVLPLTELAPALETAPTDAPVLPDAQGASDGLGRSLRPRLRPQDIPDPQPASLAAPVQEIAPEEIAPGTRMAQLGAYESEDIARREWARLSDKFGDFLDDKRRVVQRAQSGGRVFYRLRATGFDDIGDARRFCSALVAEDSECIPVVAR